MTSIVQINFELAVAAKLVAMAKKERVSIRQRDLVFVVDGARAIGCIRKLNSITHRLCGCWVSDEFRGKGIGRSLVEYRFRFAVYNTSAKVVDTFAFHSALFESLGFVAKRKFKMGTTHLVYRVPEEIISTRHRWGQVDWRELPLPSVSR